MTLWRDRNLSAPRSRAREMVRQFTPNWFAATMGTGGLALALNQFPFAVPGVHEAARALWLFNIGLFCLFSALYAARWIFFFDGARRIFAHPAASMFFGCIPMGLATIVNGFIVFGVPLWGERALVDRPCALAGRRRNVARLRPHHSVSDVHAAGA